MAITVKKADTTATDTTETVVTETGTEETVITETTPPEAPKTIVTTGPVEFLDKVPCNWVIVENEEGIVEATNLNSGEKFAGNLEDFNASLRG